MEKIVIDEDDDWNDSTIKFRREFMGARFSPNEEK